MVYRDLREWIEHLETEGELVRLKEEIRLEPDVGAISRAIADVQGLGVLADNIFGFHDARIAIGLSASWRRSAMTLGLPKESSHREMVKAWEKALGRYPVKAKMVAKEDAPCKQNIMRGEEVNLFSFPIPKTSLQDAAPYITKMMCITKDPDSGWVNAGMYRMQVLDRNRTGIMFHGSRHIAEHYNKARRDKRPLEMAVAIGLDPATLLTAAVKIPRGWDEFDFAGALRQAPVELVKAETADLPVPATAEIVLEGELSLTANLLEGPFGEFTGSYSGCLMMPIFQINTITYRNNTIFDFLLCGRPPADGYYMSCIPSVAALEQELRHNCPNITQIAYLLPSLMNCVVQGRWTSRGEARKAILAALSSESIVNSKMVTVVDEDVDPWNAQDVLWAIVTRCQANTDLVILPGLASELDPSAEDDGTGCKFGIDATKSIATSPRHSVVQFILPRQETEAWKKRILRVMKEGGEL